MRFYDPNGNLTDLGYYYYYGLKDGVWFSGDLRAIEYKNPDCSNENIRIYGKSEESEEITITRTNYEIGKKIGSKTVKTYKRNK